MQRLSDLESENTRLRLKADENQQLRMQIVRLNDQIVEKDEVIGNLHD